MAWYNESWTKRVKVTIDHTKVGATLSDFPVYIDLSELPADFHTNCNQTDARDIRVTTSDETTEVPREVVFYDSATDTGELHFKAPSLSSTTDTDFYIYYGNAGATEPASDATYGSENVWSSYNVIVHFDEDPTSSNLLDSTANNNDGTPEATGLSRVAGKVGRATAHDSKTVDFGQTTDSQFGNSDFTVSLWVQKGESSSGWSNVAYIGKWNTGSQASTNEWIMGATVSGGDNNPTFSVVSGTTIDSVNSNTALTLDTWYYIVAKRSGGTLYLYVDGVEKATNTTLGTLSINTVNDRELKTGSIEASTSFNLEGIIDELRIIKGTAFSVGWITTEYSNQSAPSTFSTIGTAESVASGTSANSERGLYITGSHTLSTDYFNVEFGLAELGSGERGLYIQGSISENSERGIYIWGADSGTSDIGLYVYGKDIGSESVGLYIQGSKNTRAELGLYIEGRAIFEDIGLYIHGSQSDMADMELYVWGKDYGSSEASLYVWGTNTDSSDIGLYVEGKNVVVASVSLYIAGKIATQVEMGLYISGVAESHAGFGLYIVGEFYVDMGLYLIGMECPPFEDNRTDWNAETLDNRWREEDSEDWSTESDTEKWYNSDRKQYEVDSKRAEC